jgi:hypothetical protein
LTGALQIVIHLHIKSIKNTNNGEYSARIYSPKTKLLLERKNILQLLAYPNLSISTTRLRSLESIAI